MDYITHIVSGAAGYRLISPSYSDSYLEDRTNYIAGGLFFIGSILPDVDNVSRLWGIEAYIVHHRGMTHSILFALGISFIFALLFRKPSGLSSFFKLFLVSFMGLISHIYMDLVTSYGTQILLPFTNKRFSLDWVFIVDPLYTLVIAFIFVLSLILLKSEKYFSRSKDFIRGLLFSLFIVWIVCYPMVCGLIKHSVALWVGNAQLSKFTLLPDLGTPFVWKLIVNHDNVYRIASINTISKSVNFDADRFIPLDENLSARISEKISSFRVYRWFAVYPYQRLWKTDGKEKIIEIGDLRFLSSSSLIKDRRATPPFTVFLRTYEPDLPVSMHYGSPPP